MASPAKSSQSQQQGSSPIKSVHNLSDQLGSKQKLMNQSAGSPEKRIGMSGGDTIDLPGWKSLLTILLGVDIAAEETVENSSPTADGDVPMVGSNVSIHKLFECIG